METRKNFSNSPRKLEMETLALALSASIDFPVEREEHWRSWREDGGISSCVWEVRAANFQFWD